VVVIVWKRKLEEEVEVVVEEVWERKLEEGVEIVVEEVVPEWKSHLSLRSHTF